MHTGVYRMWREMRLERVDDRIEKAISGIPLTDTFERSYAISFLSIVRREFALDNISFKEAMDSISKIGVKRSLETGNIHAINPF